MFVDLIGKTMEVCMDDMLVKSLKAGEIFGTLRRSSKYFEGTEWD